jgi:hypothetical protein
VGLRGFVLRQSVVLFVGQRCQQYWNFTSVDLVGVSFAPPRALPMLRSSALFSRAARPCRAALLIATLERDESRA